MVWSCPCALFHVKPISNEKWKLQRLTCHSLQSTRSHEQFLGGLYDCTVQVVVFLVVPWYFKVYYHTLKIFIDGKPLTISDVIEKLQVTPSEDKLLPGSLELMLRFPCSMHSATMTIDFDRVHCNVCFGFHVVPLIVPYGNDNCCGQSTCARRRSLENLQKKSALTGVGSGGDPPMLKLVERSNSEEKSFSGLESRPQMIDPPPFYRYRSRNRLMRGPSFYGIT